MNPYREPETPPEKQPRPEERPLAPWVLLALLVLFALMFMSDAGGWPRCFKGYPHWR